MQLGFIGCGNMANAIIGGILRAGLVSADEIIGAEPTLAGRERTKNAHGIHVTDSNVYAASEAKILFLTVKPQYADAVIEEIRETVNDHQMIISIIAGRTLSAMEEAFGAERHIRLVRWMPNTPALVGAGMTAVCGGAHVTEGDMAEALRLAGAIGDAEVVPEALFDTVTAVSGSSPAYAFLFLEALADGAVRGGMPRAQAYHFAAQALLGSAKLLLQTGEHPGVLKDMVCSPAGTTIEAVRVLEDRGFRAAVIDAMEACRVKSEAMRK